MRLVSVDNMTLDDFLASHEGIPSTQCFLLSEEGTNMLLDPILSDCDHTSLISSKRTNHEQTLSQHD